MLRYTTGRATGLFAFIKSGQEMEWVYSYNPGTHTGPPSASHSTFGINRLYRAISVVCACKWRLHQVEQWQTGSLVLSRPSYCSAANSREDQVLPTAMHMSTLNRTCIICHKCSYNNNNKIMTKQQQCSTTLFPVNLDKSVLEMTKHLNAHY